MNLHGGNAQAHVANETEYWGSCLGVASGKPAAPVAGLYMVARCCFQCVSCVCAFASGTNPLSNLTLGIFWLHNRVVSKQGYTPLWFCAKVHAAGSCA